MHVWARKRLFVCYLKSRNNIPTSSQLMIVLCVRYSCTFFYSNILIISHNKGLAYTIEHICQMNDYNNCFICKTYMYHRWGGPLTLVHRELYTLVLMRTVTLSYAYKQMLSISEYVYYNMCINISHSLLQNWSKIIVKLTDNRASVNLTLKYTAFSWKNKHFSRKNSAFSVKYLQFQ